MNAALDLLVGERLAVKELHHELLVGFRDHFHELVLILRRLRFECGRNGDALSVEGVTRSGEHIDIPGHLAAFHYGKLDGDDLGVLRNDCFGSGHEVGVFLVDGVDENESGDFLFEAHLQSLFGADGEGAGRARHDDCAVGGLECRDHLALEIEEPGDIEHIYLDILVDGVAECHADGYLALYLFVVVVHRGGAVIDFAETVNRLGGVKHGFRKGSFAFAGVPDEGDIAYKIGLESLHGIPLVRNTE